MKKGILLSAVFIAYSSFVFSQSDPETDNREKFQIGIKAGLNYSNVYDEQGDDFTADAKFGLATGAFMEIPFGKYLGIQPEIVFSQKGFKGRGVLIGNKYQFTRTTSYLDIPLQFALKPSEFITILGGPQFSYLLMQQDAFVSSTNSFVQEKEFKQENIRKNIFGITGGININLRHVVLGARAGCDLQSNNGDGTTNTPRYKNVWFQGTVGYKLYRRS
jgi:hypothetical protein